MNKFTAGALLLVVCCYVTSCSLLHSVTGRKHGRHADTAAITKLTILVDTPKAALPVAADTAKKAMPAAPDSSQILAGMLQPVFERRIAYTTFSAKAKMRFDGLDQKQEFTAHIRVKKDSAIWINITALGGVVQAARIFITPDSFFLVNYQDKEATRIALKDAAKILPTRVDFSALQNFIVGDPLRNGRISSATDDGNNWTFIVQDTAYIQQYTYSKKDTLLLASRLNTHKAGGPKAMTEYSSYMNIDNQKISSLRMLNIHKGADSSYSLDMNFTKIDLNQPVDIHFSIPDDYTIKQ